MKTLINRFVQLTLGVLFLLGTGYLGMKAWGNWRLIRDCRSQITEVVNTELVALRLEPISDVNFVESSVVLGVPTKLTFERYLPAGEADAGGSRYIGNVEGTLDRASGLVEFSIQLKSGAERRFRRKLPLKAGAQ